MNKKFALTQEPTDLVVSIHLQNLMNTYGEEKIREVLTELFSIDIPKDEEIEAYLQKSGQ